MVQCTKLSRPIRNLQEKIRPAEYITYDLEWEDGTYIGSITAPR